MTLGRIDVQTLEKHHKNISALYTEFTHPDKVLYETPTAWTNYYLAIKMHNLLSREGYETVAIN